MNQPGQPFLVFFVKAKKEGVGDVMLNEFVQMGILDGTAQVIKPGNMTGWGCTLGQQVQVCEEVQDQN